MPLIYVNPAAISAAGTCDERTGRWYCTVPAAEVSLPARSVVHSMMDGLFVVVLDQALLTVDSLTLSACG